MARIFSSAANELFEKPNRAAVEIAVVTVATSGTPIQLPDITVPDGFILAIKAKNSNQKKKIYVGNSILNVADATKRIELVGGEVIGLALTNANLLYIDSDTNGISVELITEQ